MDNRLFLLRGADPHGSELEELRATALRHCLVPTLVLAWILGIFFTQSTRLETWLPPLSLLGGSLLAYTLVGRYFSLAAVSLLLGMIAALLTGVSVHPGTYAVFAAPLIVFAAGVLMRARVGLAIAAGLSTLLASPALALHLTPETILTAVSLSFGAATLSWIATRPLYTALDWSWSSYLQALFVSEELRDQQGELGRALKDLTYAYHRLEQASRELERARAAAAEAHRLKAQFASTISHELRTPLNLIIGFSEVMVMAPQTYEGVTLPTAYRGDVEAIYRNARHLSSLIDDILDLSQIDARHLVLNKEYIRLDEVINEVVASVVGLFEAKGLSVQIDLPADLPLLHIDRLRIRQVLINLLNNAARFTQHGGVTISIICADGEVLVRVADTGIGIAPDDLPRIFDEFHQIDGSLRRQYGGTGLGLAISKRIVELHGGSIWAESTPGDGSTFCFTLPRTGSVAALPFRADWETWVRLSPNDHGHRIAIVSDQSEFVRLLARHLEGYHVVAISDIQHLRASTGREPLRAVILAAAPTEDWHSELDLVVAEYPHLPVFVCRITGDSDSTRQLGVAEYLVKPILREKLMTVLQRNSPRGRDIVIVDDSPEMVRLLQRMLRSISRRYRIRRAYDGEEAIRLLQEQRPDVVLLDLLMPNVDGHTVLNFMRTSSALRDVPVVVITAQEGAAHKMMVSLLAIRRGEGLTAEELLILMRANLNAVLGGLAQDNAQAPQAVQAEQLASRGNQ